MIDWDRVLLHPVMGVFGEPAVYTPLAGTPLAVDVVFDEAYLPVDALSDPGVTSVRPVAGVRMAQMPMGYNPADAQGDTIVIRGKRYVVKTGKVDSHGHARLDLNLA